MSLEIQETSLLSLQGWINGGTDGVQLATPPLTFINFFDVCQDVMSLGWLRRHYCSQKLSSCVWPG